MTTSYYIELAVACTFPFLFFDVHEELARHTACYWIWPIRIATINHYGANDTAIVKLEKTVSRLDVQKI